MTKVYLLPHATMQIFKIGKSNNPVKRTKRLGAQVNLKDMLALSFGTRALYAEKVFHVKFEKWRIKNTSFKEGSTEWFHMACFEECCRLLKQYHSEIKQLILDGKIVGNPEEMD